MNGWGDWPTLNDWSLPPTSLSGVPSVYEFLSNSLPSRSLDQKLHIAALRLTSTSTKLTCQTWSPYVLAMSPKFVIKKTENIIVRQKYYLFKNFQSHISPTFPGISGSKFPRLFIYTIHFDHSRRGYTKHHHLTHTWLDVYQVIARLPAKKYNLNANCKLFALLTNTVVNTNTNKLSLTFI